jgi:hypothetical protein
VAEVIQDGLPRVTFDVATFSAPSPRVARPASVRVRRRGGGALVTWGAAQFASTYEVTVKTGDGRRLLLTPAGKARQVTVPGVARGEGLQIGVVGVSTTGKRGPAGRARLSGSLQVGGAKKPKKPKKR